MCRTLYARRVLFPLFLSALGTAAVASSIFHCNLIEVSHGQKNVRGVSIGLWQTTNELNGDVEESTRYKCVPWTSEQKEAFDGFWNYGRYSGYVTFFLGVFATIWIGMTAFKKPSTCSKVALACLQFFVAIQSSMLLVVMESNICNEFECWIDIGGMLCIAGSIMFFIACFHTLALDYNQEQVDASIDKSESSTDRWDRSEQGFAFGGE